MSSAVSRRTFLAAAAGGLFALACSDEDGDDAAGDSLTQLAPTAPAATAPGGAGWASRAPLPTPRSEVASTVLDGRIYIVGGFVATGQSSNILEVYDPGSDRWERHAPMPEARDHAMAAAFGGRVYVFGGGLGNPTSTTFAYDPGADSWQRLADLPLPRTSGGAAVIEGCILVAGGVGDRPQQTPVFDPAAGAWSMGPPLPEPREHLAVAAAGGKVYVLAGRWNNALKSANVVLESLGGRWRALADVPTARGGTSAGVVGGRIAVAGGEAFDPSRTFPEVEVYDPAADAWTSAPDLPTPRHGLAVQGIGDTLYVIGGGPTAGLSVAPHNEAIRLG